MDFVKANSHTEKPYVESQDESDLESQDESDLESQDEPALESEDESDLETLEKEINELKALGKEVQDAEILDSLIPEKAKPFNGHLKRAKEWYEKTFSDDWENPRKAAKDIKERIKTLEAPVQKKDITNESFETNPFVTKPSETKPNPNSSHNNYSESGASETISENTNPCDTNVLEPQNIIEIAQDIIDKLL